jgi:hypothetical protein
MDRLIGLTFVSLGRLACAQESEHRAGQLQIHEGGDG